MDQKTPNGSDKRSWRERLGIGASKDLPRISDEFKPATNTPAQPEARTVTKPAPMAPRAPAKASPEQSDKLADKLKAQRDASEKLAEQRIIAARQRSETKATETPAVNGNGKPKFTFAEEEAEKPAAPKPAAAAPVTSAKPESAAAAKPETQPAAPPIKAPPLPPPGSGATVRPAMGSTTKPLVPPMRTGGTPNMVPPRQPLGSNGTIMPPRGNFSQTTPPRPNYTSGYVPPVPNYRSPVDPNNRYAPPPKPVTRSYTGATGGGYNNQPRLNVPPLPQTGGAYGSSDYGYSDPSGRSLRVPPRGQGSYQSPPGYGDGELFDDPRGQRRATAGEYSQAYRDYEMGYDEDMGRSRGPLLWLLLLGLAAVVALGLVWFYYNNIKPQMQGQQGNTPVVTAPAEPAKTQADQQQGQTPASRKVIYDRIVGDREVLGGDVMQSEEPPVSPADATAPQTGGEEMTPLPLPPPPGDNGTGDQQGSLTSTEKQDSAQVIPAAGESQAAGAPLYPPLPDSDVYGASGKSEPPVPGDGSAQVAALEAGKSDPVATPPLASSSDGSSALPVSTSTSSDNVMTSEGSETISDSGSEPIAPKPEAVEASDDPEPVVEKPKKIAKKVKAEEPELGSEPVVLVPPSDGQSQSNGSEVAAFDAAPSSGGTGGGLYSGEGIVTPEAGQPSIPKASTGQKKRKTLADLFRGEDQQSDTSSSFDNAAAQSAPATQVQSQPQPVVQQQVASAGGFAVQLASFRTRDEASAEFGRLQAKHSVLSNLTPIISEAQVGGSTRYRLVAGTMSSREQASAVCAKLFAGGERDCLVRRM